MGFGKYRHLRRQARKLEARHLLMLSAILMVAISLATVITGGLLR